MRVKFFSRYMSWSECPHVTLAGVFFVTATSPSETYTLSLHDALPIWHVRIPRSFSSMRIACARPSGGCSAWRTQYRSEEHTSELQSRFDLVCRLLLEKKKLMLLVIRSK